MSPVSHLLYKDILECLRHKKKNLKTSLLFRQMDWPSNKPVNVYQLTKRKTTPALLSVFPAKALQGQQLRDLLQEGELGASAGFCVKEAPPGRPERSHCWPTTAHPKYLGIRSMVSTTWATISGEDPWSNDWAALEDRSLPAWWERQPHQLTHVWREVWLLIVPEGCHQQCTLHCRTLSVLGIHSSGTGTKNNWAFALGKCPSMSQVSARSSCPWQASPDPCGGVTWEGLGMLYASVRNCSWKRLMEWGRWQEKIHTPLLLRALCLPFPGPASCRKNPLSQASSTVTWRMKGIFTASELQTQG